jgi:hypothetical protein
MGAGVTLENVGAMPGVILAMIGWTRLREQTGGGCRK